jgi:hypothetical protein
MMGEVARPVILAALFWARVVAAEITYGIDDQFQTAVSQL